MPKADKKKEKQSGFTLIEIILAVAIISIIATISISSWSSFTEGVSLNNNAKMIEAKIKLAKSYSLSALNDINYGVHFEAGSVTVFPADTAYSVGDPDNQVFSLTNNVEIYNGAGNDIIFNRLTGSTANSGTIGIRIINNPTKTKNISVNSQGQTGIDSFEVSTISPINNARHVHFNLGWNIENSTVLNLNWVDNVSSAPIISNPITMASYFNVGKTEFSWSGETVVNGVTQALRVHSWLDTSNNTVLCIMRDQTENEKLNVSFTDGIDKAIGSYTKNDITGEVNVSAGVYGGTMVIQ